MDEYKKFLAENVLSEDKVITYRYLSRALKVSVNTAKQMLYDFHKWQNDKRPGAIHATYLVYGTKSLETRTQESQDGDVEMTGSLPEVESEGDVVPTVTLSLVPEEQLQALLASYENVTSIHVYSIGPHPMKDMALLSDAARQVSNLTASDAPAGDGEIYGTIANPQARRRERRGAGIKAANVAPIKQQSAKVAAKPTEVSPHIKEEPKAPQAQPGTTSSTAVPAKKPIPTLKKAGSAGSGIMQSFAKAASKPKKTQPTQDDTPMSDGDEDDSEVLPKPKVHDELGRKSKKEREEELRRMMEEDDDDEEEDVEEKPESPIEEQIEEPPAPEPEKEEPTEVAVPTGDGRRRGKRKIMKKKQVLDDQGYLVTIQEPGWESFSEEESPTPALKSTPSSSAGTVSTAKSKKAGAVKGNQGNIMSFFSKK